MAQPRRPRNARSIDQVTYDVAIVGGGLVGGTLACALAGHGVRTVLIDRLPPTAGLSEDFDGRASAIAASGQRLLSAVGVWPHLAAHAEPIREIRVSDGPSLLFLHYDHAELAEPGAPAEPLGQMLENRTLRAGLAARIARLSAAPRAVLDVRAPATVRGVAQDADFASLTLSDGTRIRARLAVAADGRQSTLRDAAGLRVTGWDYPQVAIVATIAHDHPHQGIAHERFLSPGPFAILPLRDDDTGRHRSSLVWTEHAARAADYLALPAARFLAEIADRVGGFLGRLTLIGPRFSYPLGLQLAEDYARGRLALVGDAAHGIHPIAGQGLNLGLRDVAALTEIVVDAQRLGLDAATADGLARYRRWRRADNLLMAGATDALNRLFSTDAAPVRLARDLGLGAVNAAGPLKRLFMRHAMGLTGELPKLMRGLSI
ncbi:MAG: UbiH/UbiF/VisC/COQ6 family ubiquinone biosynthesis hydroxylase [Rhodospirillaceae bacterium]|nr:UbiH/UbiF/VisC/COQ6 family ubiquinone biosynthesis hydroxylase [Rhodospirillaceae bacterium]